MFACVGWCLQLLSYGVIYDGLEKCWMFQTYVVQHLLVQLISAFVFLFLITQNIQRLDT